MEIILKQTSWVFLAQIITRIIGFFYTIFLAKNLGVLDFGLYSVGLAYFSIISSFADFGFNRFLVREVAKENTKPWELLWNVVMIRLFLISIFFAIFSVFLYSLDPDKMRVSIILLASLAVLPQSIALTFDGIFIALQKLQFSAISVFISSISTLVVGLFLINLGFGTTGAVNALIFGQIIYALVLGLFLYKKIGLGVAKIQLSIIKKALFGSLPYGILAIMGLIYFRIDTVMLSYMKGNFDTGIYSAGYRFLESLVFIPNALGVALFPKFVKLHNQDLKQLGSVYFKSIKMMFILGLFITGIYILILPIVIRTFLPNYIQTIQVIQILSLAIPFIFVHVPAASVLLSTDKYLKQVIIISIIPLTFNIILNIVFIPQYGFIGASWVTVLSDVLSAVVILFSIKKFVLGR